MEEFEEPTYYCGSCNNTIANDYVHVYQMYKGNGDGINFCSIICLNKWVIEQCDHEQIKPIIEGLIKHLDGIILNDINYPIYVENIQLLIELREKITHCYYNIAVPNNKRS